MALYALGTRAGLAEEVDPPPPGESPAAAAQAPPTQTSATPPSRTIEEIVVTAQRREEHLHDVPVSMSAMSGDFMRQQGVTDLQDVARYVPNVHITVSGTQIEPNIRGFSTNTAVNRGLELPIGIVVDEVPYSRADYFQSGLFDLDRVEVLRGPQGQLFGANTTVGLLNLVTKNPTDEYTGFVDATFGELDARRFEGAVGGPVLRGVMNFRLAALSDEQDGYMKNTTAAVVPGADETSGDRIRRSVRAKLDFPNVLGGSLLLSYQRDHHDIGGTPRELTYVPLKYRDLLRQYDPNFDAGRPPGQNWPIRYVESLDTPQFRRADIDTVAARGHYDLGGWGLNFVGGWSRLDSHELDDADSAPWLATRDVADEASRQTTFEFRVTSPDLAGFLGLGGLLGRSLGSTDFTSGFFYQRRTQVPSFVRADIDAAIVGLSQVLNRMPGDQRLLIPRPPQKLEFFQTLFEQTANEYSGYGQMNWHFLPRWTLLYGMRLDYTKKEAFWDQTTGPTGAVLIPQTFDSFTQRDSRSEFHFSPKVGPKLDLTDNVNLYATWSHNFQGGGFNNVSSSANSTTRVVKPALVQSWEAGTKMRLLDGAAELNLGLFWMTMKDFQLFTIGTPPGKLLPVTQVVNVGKLRARGVEADGTWLPSDWLTLRAALGFNDTKYLDFPIGNCMQDRAGTVHETGAMRTDGEQRCDLTGAPLVQAPHWEASLTPSVHAPLTSIRGLGALLPSFLSKVEVTQALSVQYSDNKYLNDTDDPRQRQSSYFFLDGSLGLANAAQGWSLRFRVDNITSAAIAATSYEAYPMPGVYRAVLPPRLMYGSVRWEF